MLEKNEFQVQKIDQKVLKINIRPSYNSETTVCYFRPRQNWRIGKFGELVTENWLDQSMKIGLGELVNWERWQNWFVQDGMVELVKDLNWSIWW